MTLPWMTAVDMANLIAAAPAGPASVDRYRLAPPDLFGSTAPKKLKAGVARSVARQERFLSDLDRRYGGMLDRASPAARAELVAAYEAEKSAGPEFTRYWRGSRAVEAPENPRDPEWQAAVRRAFRDIAVRHVTVDREKAREAGKRKLTRTIPAFAGDVLGYLLSVARWRGRVFPSLDCIAEKTGLSRRTVQSCIKALVLFGFLTVTRRIKVFATALGGRRMVQDSNCYLIHMPTKGLGALAAQIFGSKGNFSGGKNRQASEIEKKEGRGGEERVSKTRREPDGLTAALARLGVSIGVLRPAHPPEAPG